jgi:hypothetical protein
MIEGLVARISIHQSFNPSIFQSSIHLRHLRHFGAGRETAVLAVLLGLAEGRVGGAQQLVLLLFDGGGGVALARIAETPSEGGDHPEEGSKRDC